MIMPKIAPVNLLFDARKLILHYRDLSCRFIEFASYCDPINSLWPGGLVKMGHFYHHFDVTEVLAISRRFGGRL